MRLTHVTTGAAVERVARGADGTSCSRRQSIGTPACCTRECVTRTEEAHARGCVWKYVCAHGTTRSTVRSIRLRVGLAAIRNGMVSIAESRCTLRNRAQTTNTAHRHDMWEVGDKLCAVVATGSAVRHACLDAGLAAVSTAIICIAPSKGADEDITLAQQTLGEEDMRLLRAVVATRSTAGYSHLVISFASVCKHTICITPRWCTRCDRTRAIDTSS